jgi:hypothetical protein
MNTATRVLRWNLMHGGMTRIHDYLPVTRKMLCQGFTNERTARSRKMNEYEILTKQQLTYSEPSIRTV